MSVSRRRTNQLLDAAAQAATADAVNRSATVRFGEVTAVDAGAKTLECVVAGVTLRGVPFMKSYASPAAGDVVWLLHQGSIVIALGEF